MVGATSPIKNSRFLIVVVVVVLVMAVLEDTTPLEFDSKTEVAEDEFLFRLGTVFWIDDFW